MAAVALLNGFTDHLRLLGRTVTHGMQQRQGRFAFVEIVAHVFTQRLAIGAVVQQVVDKLEGGTEIAAVILQPLLLCFATACQNA